MKRCHWVNQNGVQCGMPLGHATGHSNGTLTPGINDWHEYITDTPAFIVQAVERFAVVWTERSHLRRCFWHGPHSQCVYELGHTLPHKEETSAQ